MTYSTKRLNTRKMFPSLCKSCADKLDTVIERVENVTRERCTDFGHWEKIWTDSEGAKHYYREKNSCQ